MQLMSRMLENLIAGLLGQLNYSEVFQTVFKMLMCNVGCFGNKCLHSLLECWAESLLNALCVSTICLKMQAWSRLPCTAVYLKLKHIITFPFFRFLTYDPRRRITAEDALQHEYFSVSVHKHPWSWKDLMYCYMWWIHPRMKWLGNVM